MLDPSEEVAEAALFVLRTMKENSKFLKTFAKCEPILEILKKSAKDILFEMLQFNEVIDYLVKTSFLDNLISEWHSIQCNAYIENLEMTTENHQYLFLIRNDKTTDLPRHLFHCLAQTPGGLGFLLKKGNISEFVRILDESKFEDVPQLKIAAVNLANVASTEGGLSLLDSMSKSPIIPTFVTRFMECSDLCLKRIYLFCFNWLSRSAIGANELLKLNFVSKEGLCLPVLATKVLEVANIKQVRHSIYDGSWPENRRLTFAAHKYEPDSTEAEVLKCIGGLSNHIIAVSNSKTLQNLKTTYPDVFKSAKLYLFAMRLTCNYDFKLPIYRFIHDLFEQVEWTADSIETLKKGNGLRYTTIIQQNQNNMVQERCLEARKPSHSSGQYAKHPFKPSKQVKGF